MRHRLGRPAGAAVLLLACALAASCRDGANDRPAQAALEPATPTATATAAATPTASATPDPAVLLAGGGLPILEHAYNLLLDGYLDPLQPAPVLAALWDGVRSQALRQGISPPATPVFPSDRAAAWDAFRGGWLQLLADAPGADVTALRQAALYAVAQSLNDCHTFYMKPVQAEFVRETQTGQGPVSVGVELAEGPPVSVREVIAGGPAEAAGVRPGDRFLDIDGRDVSDAGFYDVGAALRGDEGSVVHARVLHVDGEVLDTTMTRAYVAPPNVESRLLPAGVGYVKVRAFVQGGITAGLDAAITRFEDARATAWVIDLRDNPGGYADVAAVSRFVSSSPALLARMRDRTNSTPPEGAPYPVIRPTVILVNKGTGSVAEAFANSLKEHGVARLIGTATAGCAGYTVLTPLGDGSTIAVTSGVSLGPVSGRVLNDGGVQPDEYAERTDADLAAGRDPPLDRARAYLASLSRTPSAAGAPR